MFCFVFCFFTCSFGFSTGITEPHHFYVSRSSNTRGGSEGLRATNGNEFFNNRTQCETIFNFFLESHLQQKPKSLSLKIRLNLFQSFGGVVPVPPILLGRRSRIRIFYRELT
jgi:hypothetical protein